MLVKAMAENRTPLEPTIVKIASKAELEKEITLYALTIYSKELEKEITLYALTICSKEFEKEITLYGQTAPTESTPRTDANLEPTSKLGNRPLIRVARSMLCLSQALGSPGASDDHMI